MDYKYKKGQIFGKRLNVPRHIRSKIYGQYLDFKEFIEYGLDDKIPISCLKEEDRKIVERFGIEKAKTLDWELLGRVVLSSTNYIGNFKNLVMSIDPEVEDVNAALYELAKNEISPNDYTEAMRKVYSDRLLDNKENPDDNLMFYFNRGLADLNKILLNWNILKDKDLSYCLLKDKNNVMNITSEELKMAMNECKETMQLVMENTDIYAFVKEFSNLPSEEEKKQYVKSFTDEILKKDVKSPTLSNEQYKELFNFSSIEDYLIKVNQRDTKKILKELQALPKDYIFDLEIPFKEICNLDVLRVVNSFGLKNVVEFDNENNNFLFSNECERLKLIGHNYLASARYEENPQKSMYFDKDGNKIEGIFTKDQFYEAINRMIMYVKPTSEYYSAAKKLDYGNINGEFRKRYDNLFIADNAPEELQNLFYAKAVTPQILIDHPEYVPFLAGKDLNICFEERTVKIQGDDGRNISDNLYNFMESKMDFNEIISFLTEYNNVLDIVFDKKLNLYSDSEYIEFSKDDNTIQIKKKFNEYLKGRLIRNRIAYPENIPQSLIEDNPAMFLSSEAPKELKKAFYDRTINSEFISSDPSYKQYLKQVDLEILYKYIPTMNQNNLVNIIKQKFDKEEAFDLYMGYGKYIEDAYDAGKLNNFLIEHDCSKEDLLQKMDKSIFDAIVEGKIKYDENISNHFKNSYPTLFLDESISKEIRDKFYNKELTLEDFNTNPKLMEMLGNTNIVGGFSKEDAWIYPLFSETDNVQLANYNRLKVISEYSKINDLSLKNTFQQYVMEFGSKIDMDKLENLAEVLSRLASSNSSEIFTFRNQLATEVMKSDNPIESLNKIEDVFIKNNIPVVGKVYSCFEILYPDINEFLGNDKISPVLNSSSTMNQKAIIFSDLIKASFGSNNRSVKDYLQNIRVGSELYESIKTGQVQFDMLLENQKKELTTFSKHLATMYNNTMSPKTKNEFFVPTGNVTNDISKLVEKLSPDGTLDYNVGDRVVRMFCGFAGVNTLAQAEEYINKKIKDADSRNRSVSSLDMSLNKGDFIKGIGNITYLRNILQNGSVSKEYLGDSAGSDNTPLDTDVSMITSSDGTISDKLAHTAASSYGPIWFVLKNDERFITTRVKDENLELKKDTSKLEAFYTGFLGDDHYGIRTGFASSEINYILMEKYDPRVGNEIAMNGFYIPIANLEGKIIFTPNDYDKIRRKMSGLSYFGEENYTFSPNLVTNDTNELVGKLDQSNYEVQVKRSKINEVIRKSLNEVGLNFKTSIDGDLTPGVVEFIDTGSTGRGTNKPGDGDFDFMMRLDKSTFLNDSELDKLKQTILKNLGKIGSKKITDSGDFRLKKVQLDDETIVDIDITFAEKTDKLAYSTDMALQDRLETIRKNNPEKYNYVISNIILAKQVLGAAEAYKPYHSEVPQGGLGGVGVENWILQNGGSFVDAVKDFVQAAEGKDFSEFSSSYQIWDFGDNHLASKRGKYEHDNFVANNMSEEGYQKMCRALKEYLKYMETDLNQVESITR